MVERWMKERAAKSFGGSCMSRFVQENERKRLLRLKNMKSSISNKHDNWTQNNVDRRHKEIKKKSCIDNDRDDDNDELERKSKTNDFDLVFQPHADFTKSGLKLKLTNKNNDHSSTNTGTNYKNQNTMNSRMNSISIKNNINKQKSLVLNKEKEEESQTSITTNNKNNQGKNSAVATKGRIPVVEVHNEGKENKSPTHQQREKGIPSTTHVATKVTNTTGLKPKPINENKSSHNDNLKKTSKTKLPLTKETKSKDKLDPDQNSMMSTRQIKGVRLHHLMSTENTKKSLRKNLPSKTRQHVYTNRGVSLISLSKEKEEAMAILNEIKAAPWDKNHKDKRCDDQESHLVKTDEQSFQQRKDQKDNIMDNQRGASILSSSRENESDIISSNNDHQNKSNSSILSSDASEASNSSDHQERGILRSEGESIYSDNFDSDKSDGSDIDKEEKIDNRQEENTNWIPEFRVESFFDHI